MNIRITFSSVVYYVPIVPHAYSEILTTLKNINHNFARHVTSSISFRGFDKLYETCLDFLLHGLAYQPISQQLCCSNKPNCNTLLVYGSGSTAGGSGKTSLAHAVCNTVGKHPILAHVSVIECVSLRG